MYPDPLAAALEFTADDLRENQQGRLSEFQRRAAQELNRPSGSPMRLVIVLLIAAAIVVGLFWLGAIGWTGSIIIAIIAVVAVLAGRFGRKVETQGIQEAAQELQEGRVMSVTGTVMLETKYQQAGASQTARPSRKVHYVNCGADPAVRLRISGEAFEAFEDGAVYTLYYLPGAQTLLSAERS